MKNLIIEKVQIFGSITFTAPVTGQMTYYLNVNTVSHYLNAYSWHFTLWYLCTVLQIILDNNDNYFLRYDGTCIKMDNIFIWMM